MEILLFLFFCWLGYELLGLLVELLFGLIEVMFEMLVFFIVGFYLISLYIISLFKSSNEDEQNQSAKANNHS